MRKTTNGITATRIESTPKAPNAGPSLGQAIGRVHRRLAAVDRLNREIGPPEAKAR